MGLNVCQEEEEADNKLINEITRQVEINVWLWFGYMLVALIQK